MPTSRRTASIVFRSSVSSVPSTTMWPSWCSSSRLMQRIMVDLPEPDGPQITMRSPSRDGQVDVAQHMELAVPFVDLVEQIDRRHRRLDGGDRCVRVTHAWSAICLLRVQRLWPR